MKCSLNKCIINDDCKNSDYGCCDDGITFSGPNGENCPFFCNCHPAGNFQKILSSKLLIFFIWNFIKGHIITSATVKQDNVLVDQVLQENFVTRVLLVIGVLNKFIIQNILDVCVSYQIKIFSKNL